MTTRKMTKFELFVMIYYALDAYYEENVSEEINNFLSDMCPFTFADEGSADPAIYAEFCDFIKVEEVEIENSFELASKYVEWINLPYVTTGFEWVTKEDWITKSKKYIESLKKK